MKHFTPERYLRLGNLKNEQVFLAGQQDWERAVEQYSKQLQRIKDELPVGLRRLIDSVYLHDARVLDIWRGSVRRFTVTLRPESDPSRLVVLAYSLEGAPVIKKDLLPPDAQSEPIAWLYDELDRKGSSWHHNILLSNGWELQLPFRSVTVQRPLPVIPGASDEFGRHISASIR